MDPSLRTVTEALKTFSTLIVSTAAPKLEALVYQNARFQGKLLAFKLLLGLAKEEGNKVIEQQRKFLRFMLDKHCPLVNQLEELTSLYQKEVECINYMLRMLFQLRDYIEQHGESLEEKPDIAEVHAKVELLQQAVEKLGRCLENVNRDIIVYQEDLKILMEQHLHQESLLQASENNGSVSRSSEESELSSDEASS